MSDESKVYRYPGDSPVDEARRIARSYRRTAEILVEYLAYLDPDHEALSAVADLDRQWQDQGRYWMVPMVNQPDDDDLLTATDVAALVHLSAAAVRQWNSRARQGKDGVLAVETPDGPRYRWADVQAYNRRRQQRRIQAAKPIG
ncbi:Uncharacterised protein [Mycobacteroides abscessus subsp. massiliense]|uniref:hypothetical protein n=1 Tax=Mycobacteroides abscessus TaxID=36809 RepID=UPI0009D44B06|nr:hypothetical protein [Mycobacteroides abscessus]SKM81632.1 Uncharacterised protein [Mycobacteroides abscessus subsp. massiliense]SKM98262.1 Uncharacterised protein [Mycobacteroides abscessus subsp. massiliense]SKN76953.1 Uncharacterised protein [Mycobacteroides abscessus subsp. massiliense]SKN96153.1 Uncharacterised protein [Mycobacteroides abscessus subsp. massiliense]SKO21734.1 Uncharacterised protein [Mycobacteroides abscessus subsp. massiliense]